MVRGYVCRLTASGVVVEGDERERRACSPWPARHHQSLPSPGWDERRCRDRRGADGEACVIEAQTEVAQYVRAGEKGGRAQMACDREAACVPSSNMVILG